MEEEKLKKKIEIMERALAVVVVAAIIVGLVCYVVGHDTGAEKSRKYWMDVIEDNNIREEERRETCYQGGYYEGVRVSEILYGRYRQEHLSGIQDGCSRGLNLCQQRYVNPFCDPIFTIPASEWNKLYEQSKSVRSPY